MSSKGLALSAQSRVARRLGGASLVLLVGFGGVLAALALPFAPVVAEQTEVTWPVPGQPVESSTAFFVPYRPLELTATVPCSAIRAAADQRAPTSVLATGTDGDGLAVRTGPDGTRLLIGRVDLDVSDIGDCGLAIRAGSDGVTVTRGDGQTTTLAGEPVPRVFAIRTELNADQASGMSIAARTASPFGTSPTKFKTLLIVVQLLCALLAMGLLIRAGRAARPPPAPDGPIAVARQSRWRTVWVDAGVIAVLASWAIIGPLSVDDGWGTMMARNFATTGNTGNYYRWWNASETPFALSYQLPAPLTEITLAPLWLRLPSTLLAVATWFVLSRGVLPAALPTRSGSVGVRLLAALCLLAAWLPFNLGARSESYVALGVTSVLALLWRARGPATVGWAALVAVFTVPLAPTAMLLAGPVVVFAPRIVSILRDTARSRVGLLGLVMLLCCVGAVGLTVIFADETWDALATATRWHAYFGPSLPWYDEPERYRSLLGDSQQGSAFKRLPVLLTATMLPIVAVVVARRTGRSRVDNSAIRLAAVVIVGLVGLSLVPSKWSYHLGAAAGLFASFLVVAVVLLVSHAREQVDRTTGLIGLSGAVLAAAAAGLAFSGPNAWWLPAVYDVPWAAGPVRPFGVPLDSALLWIGVLILVCALLLATLFRRFGTGGIGGVLVAAPAALAVFASVTSVAVLLFSFASAPVRRPEGSLAVANVDEAAGRPTCGLADDLEVLPDGDVLPRAGPSGQLNGFTAMTGFDPGTPPPDPPGSATSTELWGSRVAGTMHTGTMTSPWFVLPPQGPAGGVALSVSGRVGEPNTLILEFGRADAGGVVGLGDRVPLDRVSPELDPDRPYWRTIGVDGREMPASADRVRIRAVDVSTDPDGWLAFTGPRLRTVVGLTDFLASYRPVLVNWPMAFLFPCLREIPRVADGLAQAPRAMINEPVPWSISALDQTVGGSFAALVPFGQLYEVPTQIAGHPEIDWGTLRLIGDADARDAYQRIETRSRQLGANGVGDIPPER